MACLGIRYGGAGDCLLRRLETGFINVRSASSVNVANVAGKSRFPMISTAATGVSDCSVSRSDSSVFVDLLPVERIVTGEEYDRSSDSPSVSEKFDEWMRKSVTEIVKNIKQAPLLVHIYADGEVKTEKAVTPEDWPDLIREKPSSSPDGIILVEELRESTDRGFSGGEFDEDDGTKAFGVLIQGKFKGRDRCKSACYLLKTCSVNGGLGSFCTHFCLMKVKNFRQSASSQFNDCWVLQ